MITNECHPNANAKQPSLNLGLGTRNAVETAIDRSKKDKNGPWEKRNNDGIRTWDEVASVDKTDATTQS